MEVSQVEAQPAVEELVLQTHFNLKRILRIKWCLVGIPCRANAEAAAAEAFRIADVGRVDIGDGPSRGSQQDDVIPGVAAFVGVSNPLRQPRRSYVPD